MVVSDNVKTILIGFPQFDSESIRSNLKVDIFNDVFCLNIRFLTSDETTNSQSGMNKCIHPERL